MIAEDVQRKLWFGGLIGALILGGLFVVWAVFLNRGTIIITSKAPYSLTLEGLRTEACSTDKCSTIVAPGNYTITVQKQGYKPVTKNITVPLGQPYEDNITLQFIPFISQIQTPQDQIFPANPKITKAQRAELGVGTSTQLFFDQNKKFVAYMIRDPENFRQTLYLATVSQIGAPVTSHSAATSQQSSPTQQSFTSQEFSNTQEISSTQNSTSSQENSQQLNTQESSAKPVPRIKTPPEETTVQIGTPEVVTSFLRDLQNFVLVPNQTGEKIGIIDQAGDGSTLYVVDIKAKNRASLLNYPVIRDMRWIGGTNDFLFLARPTKTEAETVFLYRWDEAKTYKLDLKTSLDDIAIIDHNRILAVTSQKLPDNNTGVTLDGQLVPLGENQSTTEVTSNITSDKNPSTTDSKATIATYAFVDFSLIANQARLITTQNTNPFPTLIQATQDDKAIYFLQGNKVSQLRFDE